jgi:hypothetical protein
MIGGAPEAFYASSNHPNAWVEQFFPHDGNITG